MAFSQCVIGMFCLLAPSMWRYAHTSAGLMLFSSENIDLSNIKAARKMNTHLATAV